MDPTELFKNRGFKDCWKFGNIFHIKVYTINIYRILIGIV